MRKDTLSEESHVSTGLWTAPDKHGRFLADTPSAHLADNILILLEVLPRISAYPLAHPRP